MLVTTPPLLQVAEIVAALIVTYWKELAAVFLLLFYWAIKT